MSEMDSDRNMRPGVVGGDPDRHGYASPGRAGNGSRSDEALGISDLDQRDQDEPARSPDEPPRRAPKRRRKEVVLGLSVRGMNFEAGLMTMKGELLDRSMRPIDPDVGPQSHFANVAAVVTEQLDKAKTGGYRVSSIGVAIPGPITKNCETVSPLSIPSWRDFTLREHLVELTGLPVYGDVDAHALALSEGWLGSARGMESFAAIIVSVGIGGGLVIDGQLLTGIHGNAGHIGHVIVEPGGRRCRCGARGCLDAEASGHAIEAITGRSTSEPTYDIMRRTGTLVGRAAGIVCNALDLDFVVVGGDVAVSFAATFINAAQQEIDRIGRVNLGAATRLSPARLGDRGGLIGAGAVGLRGLRRERSS